MAWDDTPPTAQELGNSSWASMPPSEDELNAPSGLEAGGHAFVNNLPLGGQLATMAKNTLNDKGYSQNLADWNKQTEIDKAAHPNIYGIGAVAGAAAPLLIPGAGEVMAGAPILGNALLGAANAVGNTDLLKNPQQAVRQGVGGAILGGVVGKAGDMIGEGVNALKPAAKRAGERLEANATASALDLGTYGTRRISKGLDNPEKAILGVNEKVKELFPDLVGLSDTSGSKYEKLLQGHRTAGKAIGDVVDSTSQKLGGQIPEAQEAIEELEKAASKYNGLSSARNADARAELSDLATKMKTLQENGQLNFQALADLKTDVGSAYHNPNFQNHGIDQSYGILSDTMDKILNRTHVDNPAVKEGFDKAKEMYRLTSNILPAMKRGVIREVAGKSGGLTTAALGAGAVFGHPLAAGAGYAAKTAAHLAAPELGPNIAYKTVNALKDSPALNAIGRNLPGIRQGATQELMDFLESKYKKK